MNEEEEEKEIEINGVRFKGKFTNDLTGANKIPFEINISKIIADASNRSASSFKDLAAIMAKLTGNYTEITCKEIQDDDLIREFINQTELGAQEFCLTKARSGYNMDQLLRVKFHLLRLAVVREAHLPRAFIIESWFDEIDCIPKKIRYKHPEGNRCPVCQAGLRIGPDTAFVTWPETWFGQPIHWQGETILFFGTIDHSMYRVVNDDPVKLSDEEYDRMKVQHNEFTNFLGIGE